MSPLHTICSSYHNKFSANKRIPSNFIEPLVTPNRPWCDFVPILDGIEPLKEKMDSGVITNEQSSAIIYQATEGNISQAVALGVAAGIGWFYLTDTEEDGLPSERVFEEQVTAIVAFS